MFLSEWRKWLDQTFGTGKRVPYRHRSRRLTVEELEPRRVPSFTSVTGKTIAPIELNVFSGAVASFTTNTPGDVFVATINWGDGTTTAGTATSTGANSFDITGDHVYAEDAAGIAVTVTINDATDSTSATAGSTANVGESSLSITSIPISATEGTSFSGTVAIAGDFGSPNPASEFTATIDWGDGTTTAGAVSGSAGTYTISGDHTYADEGNFNATVTFFENNNPTFPISNQDAVTVAEADNLNSGTGSAAPPGPEGVSSNYGFFFTDSGYPTNSTSDFTATIDWGDGTTSAGSVVTGASVGLPQFPFAVLGTHTYNDEGTFTAIATITDDSPGTSSGTLTSSVPITEADTLAPAASQPSTTLTEGDGATSVPVAVFTDTGYPNNSPSDFTATIDWGDATTTAGVVSSAGDGNFTVNGTHAYADEGAFTAAVTLTEDAPGTASATANNTVTVTEGDTLTPNSVTITPTEGTGFSGTVATFSDSFTGNVAGDFTATIDWGDGTTTAGTVSGGGGSFSVSGDHTYADEGAFTTTVTLTDDAPGTATATATGTANVAEGSLTLSSNPISGTEGTAFSGQVATFSDPGSPDPASNFSATIDWGDGVTTAGAITGSSGDYTISGTHTYGDEGNFTFSVTASENGVPSSMLQVSNSATIAEGDTLTPTGVTITPTEQTGFSGTVATFSDSNTGNVAGDFTATIDWGDGVTTTGTVSGGSGANLTVTGDHTYTEDGSFAVLVTLADDAPGTASAMATTTANVAEDAFVTTAAPVNGFERTALTNITVATFTHANGLEPAGSFAATIAWGDGTISAGTVTQATSGGEYTVQGSHTYLDEPNPTVSATFPIAVTITDDTGSATVNTTASILEELLPGGTRGTANQRWLSEVYRDLLNRQIDSAGLASWTLQLNQGASRLQVVQAIENDPGNEYRTDEVQALYMQYLHRSADPSGLGSGVAFLQSGGTVEQLAAAIAGSPEYFQNRGGGTNSGFLAAFYQDALGRPIDSSGAASWGAQLSEGASRTQVAFDILNSDEYRQHLVSIFYNTFFDRATDSGSASWVNALKQGARDESVIADLVASTEFFNKTAP
jgi:hypothetical protein